MYAVQCLCMQYTVFLYALYCFCMKYTVGACSTMFIYILYCLCIHYTEHSLCMQYTACCMHSIFCLNTIQLTLHRFLCSTLFLYAVNCLFFSTMFLFTLYSTMHFFHAVQCFCILYNVFVCNKCLRM